MRILASPNSCFRGLVGLALSLGSGLTGCNGPNAASTFSFNNSKLLLLNVRVDLVAAGGSSSGISLQSGDSFAVTAALLDQGQVSSIAINRLGAAEGSGLSLEGSEVGKTVTIEGRLPLSYGSDSALLSFTLNPVTASGLVDSTSASLQALAVAKPNQPAAANVEVHISLASTAAAQILSQASTSLTPNDTFNAQMASLVSNIETLQVTEQSSVIHGQTLPVSSYINAMLATLAQDVGQTATIVSQLTNVLATTAQVASGKAVSSAITAVASGASAGALSSIFTNAASPAAPSPSAASPSPASSAVASSPSPSTTRSSSAPILSYAGASGTVGSVGTEMSVTPTTLTTNGAAITGCALASGSLPTGLTLAPTTCIVSGTPASTALGVTYSVIATNAAGASTAASLVLTITAAPTLSYSLANGNGTTGAALSIAPTSLSTSGATLTGCALSAGSAALPAGLALNVTTCMVSGTPSAAGTAALLIVASSAFGTSAAAPLTVTIVHAPSFSYSGASGTTGTYLSAMSVTPTSLNFNGAVASCVVATGSPALPAGLSVNNTTCAISGIPTTTAAATTYTVLATGSNGSATTATVALTVNGSACDPTLYAGGDGSAANPFQITDSAQLANVGSCQVAGAYFVQENAIALGGSGSPWTAMPTLAGTYNGQNYPVSGLYIANSSGTSDVGLFASVLAGGVLENLILSGVNVTGANVVGALVGKNSGTVSSCVSSGTVALNSPTTTTNSVYVGGLVGSNVGVITGSSSSAAVFILGGSSSYSTEAAGLVGLLTSPGFVESSFATGSVGLGTGYTTGNTIIGGLIASMSSGSVTQSYSTGNLTAALNGTMYMGMVGSVGGTVSITSSYASGTFTVPSFLRYAYMGSLVGYLAGSGTLANNYGMATINTGSPVNGGAAGGLFGSVSGSPTISYSYYAGASLTSGGSASGKGIYGTGSPGSTTDVFYYANGSVPSDASTGVSSLSTSSNMESQSSFTGFDFTNTWAIPTSNSGAPSGLTSPVLLWQCNKGGISC